MRYFTFRVLWKRIKAIRFMMKDKTVPKWKKFLVIFGIVYLIMPIDLIPVMIFPFSFIDDLVLWVWILIVLKDTLDSYWLGEKEVDLSKNFDGKIIIDDVKYNVDTGKAGEAVDAADEAGKADAAVNDAEAAKADDAAPDENSKEK